MIFGKEKAAIPTYFNDDEPKGAEKMRFGRVQSIFSNLNDRENTFINRKNKTARGL